MQQKMNSVDVWETWALIESNRWELMVHILGYGTLVSRTIVTKFFYDHSRSVSLELNTWRAYWAVKWTFPCVCPGERQNWWCPWSRFDYMLAQESRVTENSGNHASPFIVKLSIYLRIIYSRWEASGGFIVSFSFKIGLKRFQNVLH